jgi:hypothetical protein
MSGARRVRIVSSAFVAVRRRVNRPCRAVLDATVHARFSARLAQRAPKDELDLRVETAQIVARPPLERVEDLSVDS